MKCSQNEKRNKQNQINQLEYLIKENKNKQNALLKANDLIQLLKIELEVQKNSKQQAIRNAIQKLNIKHKVEIQMYKRKIDSLQNQLKKLQSFGQKDKKNFYQTWQKLHRSSSHNSLSRQKQKHKNSSPKSIFHLEKYKKQGFTILKNELEMQFIKQTLLSLQQKQNIWVQSWAQLIGQETQQFQKITNKYQTLAQKAKQTIKYKCKKNDTDFKKQSQQYVKVIGEQQILINQLKYLIKDLEDNLKYVIMKLNSSVENKNQQNVYQTQVFDQKIQNFFEGCIKIIKQTIKQKQKKLIQQNNELKSILDSMIKLVKQEKKSYLKKKN